MESNIVIDYFEFNVLIEASWYAGTILRHSIMLKAINTWYHLLSENEQAKVYEFFNRTQEAEKEIQKRFLARYNPNNQFSVTTCYKGETGKTKAYFFNGKYWINDTTMIDEKYIIEAVAFIPGLMV